MNTFSKALVAAALVALAGGNSAWSQEEEFVDPLGEVIVDMQVAGGRLAKLLTDKPTQQKQKDAVDKLAALVKLLEEQRRRQQGGGGGGMPDRPLDDSRIVGGPGGSGPMHAARRNGANWGQLPAHKRQEILQSMTEGFPPHYQQILERYYRRLAEEKPAGEAEDDGTPGGEAAPAKPAAPPADAGASTH
jgi:hypothetical protein